MAQATMNILITVEHNDVRRGLRGILGEASPDLRFSEAINGYEFVKCLAEQEYPSFCLTSICLKEAAWRSCGT